MSSATTRKRKFIIDTDAGLDDAQAILMALSAPDVDVIAMTTVTGNAKAHQVTVNLLRLLREANRLEIPVYKGCEDMLLGWEKPTEYNYHGTDGFGDVLDEESPNLDLVQRKHGVQALLDLTLEYPGEITLVAIGPLTNVAMAVRMDRGFGKRLKDCFIMGGNHRGQGNITPCGEFNFHSDPEAAHIVLNNIGCPVTIATWELCFDCSLTWEVYEDLRSSKSKLCEFLRSLEVAMVTGCKERNWETYVPCDEIAMACAVDDDVITKSSDVYASVELHGRLTRCQMVVDWNGTLGEKTNVRIVKEIDIPRYLRMLKQAVSNNDTFTMG